MTLLSLRKLYKRIRRGFCVIVLLSLKAGVSPHNTTKRLLIKSFYSLDTFHKQASHINNMMSVPARKNPSGRPELD
ncbi:hypothetical protein SPNIH35_00670 [Streptococcus pyogenes]|nr:hypothetical protein SPNIH35_00670 [Streptococcus pyogenes]